MSHDVSHRTPVKTYVAVFAVLSALTLLTVGLSYVHLPMRAAVPLGAAIALAKCSLIAGFFMHLRFESKTIFSLLATAFFLVAVLVFALFPDVAWMGR